MFKLTDEQFDQYSTGLAVVVLALALFVCWKKMTSKKSEGFQAPFATPSPAGQCKVAADAFCTQRCKPGGENMTPGEKQKFLGDVLQMCGPDFKIDAYCYGNFNSCPMTATDLIMGGTHNLAYKPVQLIPQLSTSDPYTNLTNWGLYEWKNEGKAQGTTLRR